MIRLHERSKERFHRDLAAAKHAYETYLLRWTVGNLFNKNPRPPIMTLSDFLPKHESSKSREPEKKERVYTLEEIRAVHQKRLEEARKNPHPPDPTNVSRLVWGEMKDAHRLAPGSLPTLPTKVKYGT